MVQMKLLQPAWELTVLVEGVFGCPCTVNRFTVASVSAPGKLILVSEMCKVSYHRWDWTDIHRSEEKKLSLEYFNLFLNTPALSSGSSQVVQHLSLAKQSRMGLTENCIQFHVKSARRKKSQKQQTKQTTKKKKKKLTEKPERKNIKQSKTAVLQITHSGFHFHAEKLFQQNKIKTMKKNVFVCILIQDEFPASLSTWIILFIWGLSLRATRVSFCGQRQRVRDCVVQD